MQKPFSFFLWKLAANFSSFWYLYWAARVYHRPLQKAKNVEADIFFRNQRLKVALRLGTTDISSFREMFEQDIYALPPGYTPRVILDAGANVGLAALRFWIDHPGAIIHSYEPVSGNFRMLEMQKHLNGVIDLHCHPYGFSDRDEDIEFGTSGLGDCWSYSAFRQGEGVMEKVQLRRARTVIEELGVSSVDVLKLDIEGNELRVLRDLEPWFDRIEIILGEIHCRYVDYTEVVSLLRTKYEVDLQHSFGEPSYLFRASKRPWQSYA